MVGVRNSPEPRVLVVYERASKEDELMGESACGRSGKLVRRLLEESGLSYHITPLVRCLGGTGRQGMKECRYWLEQEMASPRQILYLGKSVAGFLSGQKMELGQQLGNQVCWLAPAAILACGRKKMQETQQLLLSLRST